MIELMTIGYESFSRAEFFGILDRCRVTMLVDIGELPISRKPGFAKAALEAALVKRGLKYRAVMELGCPRDVRHEYRADNALWPHFPGRRIGWATSAPGRSAKAIHTPRRNPALQLPRRKVLPRRRMAARPA